jgi:uncharacterized membrane protein YhaH (DUF805 family)
MKKHSSFIAGSSRITSGDYALFIFCKFIYFIAMTGLAYLIHYYSWTAAVIIFIYFLIIYLFMIGGHSLSMRARRFNDVGKGWGWSLLGGSATDISLAIEKGQTKKNEYGDVPTSSSKEIIKYFLSTFLIMVLISAALFGLFYWYLLVYNK